jgi:hydroxysqualene dehydroxylase
VGRHAQPAGRRSVSEQRLAERRTSERARYDKPEAGQRAGGELRGADRRAVVVVGGGVAGITAALDCAQAGAQVTLLEVRPRLGGAAYSFERDGLPLDNGQHVFLRCCTAYRQLLERLGSASRVRLQPRLEIPVLSPGCEPVILRRGPLPAPLHLAGALARYPHLTPRQRLSAARAAHALGRVDRHQALQLERSHDYTLGRWLSERGQGADALAALWDLVALPTLNLPAQQASLALGAFVLQTALLERADAGDIGFHVRPLSETIGDPALRALKQAGVEVRLGWRVEQVLIGDSTQKGSGHEGSGLEGPGRAGSSQPRSGDEAGWKQGRRALEVHANGSVMRADAVIVAVPHTRAASMLEDALGVVAKTFETLGNSPIVNVHVVYDRRVCDLEFAAGVGTPVQYVFDRTEAVGLSHGQYLAVSVSAAEREMGMSGRDLHDHYLVALAELFPKAREAHVLLCVASREHAATFAARPGTEERRPGARTAVPGLALAGAWTDTRWPATLEGAVRSGHAAANVALQSLHE